MLSAARMSERPWFMASAQAEQGPKKAWGSPALGMPPWRCNELHPRALHAGNQVSKRRKMHGPSPNAHAPGCGQPTVTRQSSIAKPWRCSRSPSSRRTRFTMSFCGCGGGGARDVLHKPSYFRPARLGFQLGTRRGDCRACSSWPQGNLRIFPTLFWNSSSSSMPEMALLTASSTAVRQGRTA